MMKPRPPENWWVTKGDVELTARPGPSSRWLSQIFYQVTKLILKVVLRSFWQTSPKSEWKSTAPTRHNDSQLQRVETGIVADLSARGGKNTSICRRKKKQTPEKRDSDVRSDEALTRHGNTSMFFPSSRRQWCPPTVLHLTVTHHSQNRNKETQKKATYQQFISSYWIPIKCN